MINTYIQQRRLNAPIGCPEIANGEIMDATFSEARETLPCANTSDTTPIQTHPTKPSPTCPTPQSAPRASAPSANKPAAISFNANRKKHPSHQ
jgi:hypothetical protein